ncbi:unnamed protein product [Lepidochelys kempii]
MAAVTGLTAPGCWPLWFLAVLQAISVYGAQLSSEACRELGFSSNLLCSSCNLLGQFSLNQLDPFCRECCQEEAQFETRKWEEKRIRSLPVYVVKTSRRYRIPIISMQVLFLKCVDENWEGSLKFRAFVRSDKPKLFRGLQIKYVRGSDPVLKLLDDSGNIAEELSILKWNTDSVEEFLSEKLERI